MGRHLRRGGCQAWQGWDTGRVGRCVHCKVNMVPLEATCPLMASPFCPLSPGRGRGEQREAALDGFGGPRPGEERLRGRGLERSVCGLCVQEPCKCQLPHRRSSGAEGRAPQGRRMPGLLSRAEAEGEPCPARANTEFSVFFFFLARWCSFGRDSSAEGRSREEKGMGEAGGEKPEAHLAREPALGSQTTGQWLQLPRRHFLPEQPGSSVLCQPSLRAPCLLFSKQAP